MRCQRSSHAELNLWSSASRLEIVSLTRSGAVPPWLHVRRNFPNNRLLVEWGIESYLGVLAEDRSFGVTQRSSASIMRTS
jgi:hypothetical protein